MKKKALWAQSYDRAMTAERHALLPAIAEARDEIHERIKEMGSSRSERDERVYGELMLALDDLSVVSSSFWKRRAFCLSERRLASTPAGKSNQGERSVGRLRFRAGR